MLDQGTKPKGRSRSDFVLQANVRAIENQMRVVRPLVLRLSVERSFEPCCQLLAEIYGYEMMASDSVSDAHVRILFARSLQGERVPEAVRRPDAKPGSFD
ncbi:MAG TPA: hypothetical protein VHV57_15540 [Acidimicrobiales bacterium]|jgi:hypothetical protein|nr:hypothetical protein [Acidimicrobiales bacterium]